ncbi:hypothetical protein [Phenylobacterium sp.]|jgi:hypothetical protein|uniref:hypothetical protein n=1 Tax=Phenylobacterium sp. TaxID=1871053 RepID=UPI002E2FDC0F|nr:hypothetical protein [Phenylobacterium sp.]HEX2561317.1 hypothetical protein [Phenylobacterium sp.]
MALPDRSALRRRLAWLAASFALLALAGLAIWLARPDEPEPAPLPPAPAPAPPQPAPAADALTREALVAAVEAALLPPLTPGERPPAIPGRRFQVTLPIRCPEALGAAAGAPLTYTYDTVQQAVTLTARPQSWEDTPLVAAVAPDGAFEAVEGFWIDPLPLASPTCAPAPADAPTPAAEPAQAETGAVAPPRVGLAVFFQPGGSRALQRRDRPYRITRKAPPPTGAAPYNLVLDGRVTPFEQGPAIRCHALPGEPPACLIAASVDRVAFVDAATGAVLAEWRG